MFLNNKLKLTLTATLIVMLGGCGESNNANSSRTGTWYSNGYALKQFTSYDRSGAIDGMESCEWLAERREQHCEYANISEGYSRTEIQQFNADGRLLKSTLVRDDNVISAETTYTYVDNKIATETYVNPSHSDYIETYRYAWQGDDLLRLDYYEGLDPDPEDADYITQPIQWSEGRLKTYEYDFTGDGDQATDRRVYSYNNQGRLVTIREESRSSPTDEWQLIDQLTIEYDEQANVSITQVINSRGEVTTRAVYEWQYIGETIENFSLTIGLELF